MATIKTVNVKCWGKTVRYVQVRAKNPAGL